MIADFRHVAPITHKFSGRHFFLRLRSIIKPENRPNRPCGYTVLNSMQTLMPGEALTALARKLCAIEDYARLYYLHTSPCGAENSLGGGSGGDGQPGGPEPELPPLGGD